MNKALSVSAWCSKHGCTFPVCNARPCLTCVFAGDPVWRVCLQGILSDVCVCRGSCLTCVFAGDPVWRDSGGAGQTHPRTQSGAGRREPLLQPHVHMWETHLTPLSSHTQTHLTHILLRLHVQRVWWRPPITRWSLAEQNRRSSSCWWSLSTRLG